MLGIKRKRNIEAYIPTASMADIAFLLITFFMVTTTFQVDKTQVRLPNSYLQNEVPKGAAFVVVKQIAGGSPEDVILKFSNGKDNSIVVPNYAELAAYIQNVTSENMSHVFVIKADAEVAYRKIDDALDALRRAQAQNVIYLTQPKGKRGEGGPAG